MSFFGLPQRPAHNSRMPGFGQAPDHFAALSSKTSRQLESDEGLDFEDTYDGLGDQLDEKDDDLNDDTFGASEPVGKDFDFYGSTAKVADTINEEHMVFSRQAPKKPQPVVTPKVAPAKPMATAVKSPEPIPDLQPEMSLWNSGATASNHGYAPLIPQYQAPHHEPMQLSSTGPKKFMSLEEVEAQILAQSQKPPQPVLPQVRSLPPLSEPPQLQSCSSDHQLFPPPAQFLQHTATPPPHNFLPPEQRSSPAPSATFSQGRPRYFRTHSPAIPSGSPAVLLTGVPTVQLQQPTDEDRARMLEEESRRLKRNHKIAQLARYNGLMTPADKNFITRIQLQQLVSVNEDSFAEDFYYQVHSAIQARNNPQQPLNQFAQTYLFQQGQYHKGGKFRRQDNHLQRMEQQVQRAVAAAKARPKVSQLVLEGSLGKISFSNVKTPRPMLNIHKAGEQPTRKAGTVYTGANKKALLRAIENIYDTLLDLEMHERVIPPSPAMGQPLAVEHIEWKPRRDGLVDKLWREMKIMEPIDPNSSSTHPFIAILSYAKGKKAIPRIFRHIDPEQRVTILTMIVVHLDILDVVKSGIYHENETSLPTSVREEIEVFAQTVLPPLLGYVSEAPLHIVIGLLGILLERVDVVFVAKTKIGVAFLTMFTSRAEIIKQSGTVDPVELANWSKTYDRLFETLEPHFLECFPPANFVDDVYMWQFLASMAVGATALQQQRLVAAVKDRVLENVMTSKALPPDVGAQKSANVNLFMRAIGLDVELLG
ncbi:topoisomerase II-associated protein PAT1 [Terfezia claveryi]|nr:topoisomerase II-associated protein PAT1 [Terfezia claveryi]KAF8435570.1 topoisomerase II-associated protein PAT1 [Terfezia claveryi]